MKNCRPLAKWVSLYRRFILGLYRGYTNIMEKKVETTLLGLRLRV